MATKKQRTNSTAADPTHAAKQRAKRLIEILRLEKIEENLYLGQNETRNGRRLFGGQVLAQAATAASATIDELQMHSLHAYFLRAGDDSRPVLFEVERIRDGKSFATRRVVAVQNGAAIFNMDVSFQIDEVGFDHTHPMPNVPLPDELEDDSVVARSLDTDDPKMSPMAKIDRPFELRSVFRIGTEQWGKARFWSPTWIRFRAPVESNDRSLARALLAYASDMSLVSTAALPHAESVARADLQMASLDHALWIHREVPIDSWILFHKRTSSGHGSRGMVHADFFSLDGDLVASVSQEGLLRLPLS